MTKPSNFIIHSGYASLKNDSSGTISLTVPNGMTIAPNGTGYLSTTMKLGTQDASLRGRGMATGGSWHPGLGLAFQINFRYDGITMPDVPIYVQANIERISADTIRLYVNIGNPTTLTMRLRQSKTVTFVLSSFLSPFQ